MKNHNFRRFIVLIGLTFTLMLGIFTTPTFAQVGSQYNKSEVIKGGPGPVVTAFVYKFPNEDITYTESKLSVTPSSFDYKGQLFGADKIRVLNAEFGKAASVTISSLDNVDVVKTFTLLLPNDSVKNDDKIEAVGITVNNVSGFRKTSYQILDGTVNFKF